MQILCIFDGDYPWDVRVEKMLRSLVAAGHGCALLARNRQGRPRRERLDGFEIRRLPSARRLESLASFPAFFHPRWVRAALRAAREVHPDRIVVRELPLAPLALWLGRRCGRPVVVDMAEPYPLALRSNWQFDRLGGLDHLTRNPKLADWVERAVVRLGPRVLVVSEEAGARLERIGLPRERWTLVGNTPDVAETRALARREVAIPEVLHGAPLLLFTGILVGDRGLDVAIRGLALLRDRAGSCPGLLVIGEGPARSAYEEEVRRAQLADRVVFLGWRDHEQLPAYWARADVGILPFRRCPHIDTTLANKLFDYMAVGLPILASDAPPMLRVLRETGAGRVFRGDDPEDFARAVAGLVENADERHALSERGLRASERDYDWARDAARLLAAVEAA